MTAYMSLCRESDPAGVARISSPGWVSWDYSTPIQLVYTDDVLALEGLPAFAARMRSWVRVLFEVTPSRRFCSEGSLAMVA